MAELCLTLVAPCVWSRHDCLQLLLQLHPTCVFLREDLRHHDSAVTASAVFIPDCSYDDIVWSVRIQEV